MNEWIVGSSVKYYGCCKCQKHHYEPDPLYTEHLAHQSKHGLQRITKELYEKHIVRKLLNGMEAE